MYSTGSTLSAIRGNEEPSPIKTELETWYASNLQDYDKYISKTAIYCNDRSTQTEWLNSGEMYYNGYTKFNTNKSNNTKNHPSFKCGVDGSGKLNDNPKDNNSADIERKKDMFSVSESSGGNGDLDKPIGLMTADEVIYAGSLFQIKNGSVYYYRNDSGESSTGTNWWWTMSPYSFNSSDSRAYVFVVGGSNGTGSLGFSSITYSGNVGNVVRPVISLKSCVELTGSGASTDPYEVVELNNESKCAKSEN